MVELFPVRFVIVNVNVPRVLRRNEISHIALEVANVGRAETVIAELLDADNNDAVIQQDSAAIGISGHAFFFLPFSMGAANRHLKVRIRHGAEIDDIAPDQGSYEIRLFSVVPAMMIGFVAVALLVAMSRKKRGG